MQTRPPGGPSARPPLQSAGRRSPTHQVGRLPPARISAACFTGETALRLLRPPPARPLAESHIQIRALGSVCARAEVRLDELPLGHRATLTYASSGEPHLCTTPGSGVSAGRWRSSTELSATGHGGAERQGPEPAKPGSCQGGSGPRNSALPCETVAPVAPTVLQHGALRGRFDPPPCAHRPDFSPPIQRAAHPMARGCTRQGIVASA